MVRRFPTPSDPKCTMRPVMVAAAATLVAGAALVATAGTAAAETCPAVRDVRVTGAESHYTVSCSRGQVFVSGRVKDTLPGFGCAEVKVQIQNRFYTKRSCSGTKDFRYSGPGHTAYVWTYRR